MRRMMLSSVLWLTVVMMGCSPHRDVSFTQDVQPILKKHCFECHLAKGEGAQKSGFHVDSYEAVMKGTKFGPVVVAGDSTSSSLYRLLSGQVDKSIQMPHGKASLSSAEIATIAQWIDQGAKNN
jgi:uncharacterized membrane protein